ncbi:hypothetical protein [bacterium endosymbiont of Bathymodiolus sp. 5 South]|uniref:hypothetical protein n=1 Tax=bacterium endosymbiont of Bathymodiolus sp. 5 South TaxID=1181670 RepID=UPI0015D5744C|nr:hypothetical protein [bacterium endosymbiont of Bathymodiolus sp. 5 South]
MISLNLVLAGLRLGLKNCQVGEKWVSDDCSYLCKGLIKTVCQSSPSGSGLRVISLKV